MEGWRKKKIIIYITFAIMAVLPATATFADIYRYVDANGVMHFTNAPTSSSGDFKLFLRERTRPEPSWYYNEKYDDLISEASKRHGVSFPLLKAIIKAESDFDPQCFLLASAEN